MTKTYKLSEEEAKIIDNYRFAESKDKDTKENNDSNDKEEKEMKDGTKKVLKTVGIVAGAGSLLGGIGYGIYKIFFEDPSGLEKDFDKFEEEDDVFEDEDEDDDDDLFAESSDKDEEK